jgi:hypothetical protein
MAMIAPFLSNLSLNLSMKLDKRGIEITFDETIEANTCSALLEKMENNNIKQHCRTTIQNNITK